MGVKCRISGSRPRYKSAVKGHQSAFYALNKTDGTKKGQLKNTRIPRANHNPCAL